MRACYISQESLAAVLAKRCRLGRFRCSRLLSVSLWVFLWGIDVLGSVRPVQHRMRLTRDEPGALGDIYTYIVISGQRGKQLFVIGLIDEGETIHPYYSSFHNYLTQGLKSLKPCNYIGSNQESSI